MLTPGAGLYDPMYEHDACGLGFVARLDGRRTRETVEEGLEVLHNLEHRGTTGSDPETAARERKLTLRLAEVEAEAAELRIHLSVLLEEEEELRKSLEEL